MPRRRTPVKQLASRMENELANLLWEMGYAVVRGPSSGSGVRKRYQPDIVAVKKGVVIVIEVKKASRGKPVYIPARQVRGLREFAERSGGVAYIAVRLPGGDWRMHKLSDLPVTPSGGAKVADPESGLRVNVLDEILFPHSRRLTDMVGAREG